jgi:hypothetical protein
VDGGRVAEVATPELFRLCLQVGAFIRVPLS